MTHYDQIIDDPEQAPPPRSSALRRVRMLLIVLCGFLMILVLLSSPDVSTAIRDARTSVSQGLGQLLPVPAQEPETVATIPAPVPVTVQPGDAPNRTDVVSRNAATPPTGVPAAAKPAVHVMPQNRVPVRRPGASD